MHAIVKICNEELGHIIFKYFISVEKHTIHARCPICPCGNRFMFHALFTSTTKALHCKHIQWTLDIWCYKSQNKKIIKKLIHKPNVKVRHPIYTSRLLHETYILLDILIMKINNFNQMTFLKMMEPIKFISPFFS